MVFCALRTCAENLRVCSVTFFKSGAPQFQTARRDNKGYRLYQVKFSLEGRDPGQVKLVAEKVVDLFLEERNKVYRERRAPLEEKELVGTGAPSKER